MRRMKLAVMQPYIFPYIGYVQLMAAADRFVFLDDVNYINKGWINRNRILVNHKDSLFTIPLKDASQNRLIDTIEILPDEKWRGKLLRTIEMAYKKAPQFPMVFPLIERILQNQEKLIGKFIFRSFVLLNEYLGIKTELLESSALPKTEGLKAQDKILDICLRQGADQYINAIGGQALYSREAFEGKGVKINFIKTLDIRYAQFAEPFVPWLSIVDVMMFNPPEKIREILGAYELI